MSLTRVEKAYIAGIIDGEGCIYVKEVPTRGRTTIKTVLVVNLTSLNLIRWLQSKTKMGNVNPSTYGINEKRRREKGHKKSRRWEVSGKEFTTLLKAVFPYLRIKGKQAKLALELKDLQAKSNAGMKYDKVRQDEIVKKIKNLNRRGEKRAS